MLFSAADSFLAVAWLCGRTCVLRVGRLAVSCAQGSEVGVLLEITRALRLSDGRLMVLASALSRLGKAFF